MNATKTATRLKHGIIGGLVGGAVFGMMMLMMGMLPMIGKMVGQPNAVVGFLVHMAISAGIGGSFALFFGSAIGSVVRSLSFGAAYGGIWWVLGPLTLMPLFMGMGLGVNWNLTAAQNMLPSLMGHMIFGLVMGFVTYRAENCILSKLGGGAKNGQSEERATPRAV